MYSQITANKRKTIVLIVGFLALIGLLAYIGGLYAGNFSVTIGALVGGAVYALISYFGASSAALAFNGAKEIQKHDDPRLWRIVENLAITEGLPMPKVHIIPDTGFNAFATGRDPQHASVAITSGFLEVLEDVELQGVMAHEMGHIKNYDIRVSMIVFGLVAVISVMTDILLRMTLFGGRNNDEKGSSAMIVMLAGIIAFVVSPIIAALIQAAISRKREYLADATGAMTTRYPEGLARALEKIASYEDASVMQRQNTSTAHLFFANPLKGGSIMSLFSTHPPLQERIAILRKMDTTV